MRISDLKMVVTGAASGMGRHFALTLARAGADVMGCDVDSQGLARLQEEAGGVSGRLVTCTSDVSVEGDVDHMFSKTIESFESVNGLINNAGIFRDGLLVKRSKETGETRKMSLDKWQSVLDVNLTGPFLCARTLAAIMIEHGVRPGVIVNISSISRHGNMGQSNYSAAKAGLVADTAVWAKELAGHGIRVGAVAPGFIDTPLLKGMRPEMLEKMVRSVPLGRLGSVDEVYQGVKFIIECDYFTGRCIDIDGGLVL